MRIKRLITLPLVLGSFLVLMGGAPAGSVPAVEPRSQEVSAPSVATAPSIDEQEATSQTATSRDSAQTAASSNRRTTGNGGTLKFGKGESVAGEIISLRNPNGTWGKTWYRCKLPSAPKRGRVTSGVINYFKKEVKNLPLCSDTLASATPRRPTGNGNWGNFQAGDHVLGFAIEINLGSDGRTYFKCAMKSVPSSGRVNSGVVNPSRFEIGDTKSCSTTNNWRPGFRTESGNSSLRFAQGDWIVAAFIRLDNGQEFNGTGNGCHMVAPSSGTLYGGVRNYWPGEDTNLPAC